MSWHAAAGASFTGLVCRLCGRRSSGSEQQHHAGAENVSEQFIKKSECLWLFISSSLCGLKAGVEWR